MNYKIGDIFELDNEYGKRVEFCRQNGLIIVEVEKANGKRQFTIKESPALSKYELVQQEIWELKTWFDKTYTYQEQKYRRLMSLKKLNDDGVEADIKLRQLYEEAENKRIRIQELENIIKETNA